MTKKTIKEHLEIILDFVERWNKQDEEVEVANSILILEKMLKENNSTLTSKA